MRRPRILIVDDDRNARDALRELLADAGWEVETASSACEALALVDRFAPSVLLTDWRMPKIDGRQLAEAIGKERAPEVVFMSAWPPPSGEQRPWLAKPLDVGALLTTIGHLVALRA